MVTSSTSPASAPIGWRMLLLLGLFGFELGLLALTYQFLVQIDCHLTEDLAVCRGLRNQLGRVIAVAAMAALLSRARPVLISRFLQERGRVAAPLWAIALHFIGILLLFMPYILAQQENITSDFNSITPYLLIGSLCAAIGGILWLAPPSIWRDAFGPDAKILGLALAVALILPDLAELMLPLWHLWPVLTLGTFALVALMLLASGFEIVGDVSRYIIGTGDFAVEVSQQCSGVEGLALVSGFTLIYAVMFHRELRMTRYWLVVLPLGLLASWLLNGVRITVLIALGDLVSPELAVNGFHSYAGWLFFTLLALGLMYLVHISPWLHRAPDITAEAQAPAPVTPLREDWIAACILPFILFMISSTIAASFFVHPELGYPLKAAALAAAVYYFLPALRQKSWDGSHIALVTGAAIGIYWVVSAPNTAGPSSELNSLLAGLSGVMFSLWAVLRLAGTTILVPLVEELFFRGYLLERFAAAQIAQPRIRLGMTIFGVILSAGLFGLLHGRWFDGFIAGLLFGLIYLRRRSIADAVWAHVAANVIVAVAALIKGDFTLI